MKSANSFAREQRTVNKAERATKSTSKKKQSEATRRAMPKRVQFSVPTPGEWQQRDCCVVCGDVTLAVADLRRVPPEVAKLNIRLMANAKRLYAIAAELSSAKVGKTDFEKLIQRAKEAIGGTHG